MDILSGHGLWYGLVDRYKKNLLFTEETWERECIQAVTWGIQVLHPCVANGGELWYDTAGFQMLKTVSDRYNLICAPYHICKGDLFGSLIREAQICARLGSYFGAICPVLLEEWEAPGALAWARTFGEHVRAEYQGGVFPVTFANPEQHPNYPWIEMNVWASAFLPQVFFASWQPSTAENAIRLVYPQWMGLNQRSRGSGGQSLMPMLPIISLENGIAPSEIISWLQKTHDGYCGFWSADLYPGYAQPILATFHTGDEPTQMIVVPPAIAAMAKPTPSFPPLPVEPTTPANPYLQLLQDHVTKAQSSTADPVAITGSPVLITEDLPSSPETSPPTPDPVLSTSIVTQETANAMTETDQPAIQDRMVDVTDTQLKVLWKSHGVTTWEPESPLVKFWIEIVRNWNYHGMLIGAPTQPITKTTVDEEPFSYIICESGHKLVYFENTKTTVLF